MMFEKKKKHKNIFQQIQIKKKLKNTKNLNPDERFIWLTYK